MENAPSGYGLTAICLHWLMALAIFCMYALGLYMVRLDYYHPWYQLVPTIHKTLGVSLALLWCVRLINRLLHGAPKPHGMRWEARLTHLAHWMLYVLMVALFATGYFISTADGHDLHLAWGLHIPAIPPLMENQEDVMGKIHAYLAHILIAVVAIHTTAALRHHFILRDDSLRRMLKPISNNPNINEDNDHA